MRRTRLRWMYLPRYKKKEEKDHPMQVQNSEQFLRSAGILATLTCLAAAVMALRRVQKRQRHSEQELLRKRTGPSVVIIGAGAGGCATAASIANAAPNVRITVIEKDRQQIFQGQVPLAHAGHRSYDLGTTTGMDTLRSPAAWNVTRDANLVAAEVLRVDPEAKKVYVQTSPGMLASAKLFEDLSEDEKLRHGPAAPSNFIARWWRGTRATPSTLSVNADGSRNLSDGTTVVPYDVLVVAAGAQRTLGHLQSQLLPQQIDSYRIAVNPGTTRDSLANLFVGNVVHVKVPPASFVWQMEAARAVLKRGQKGGACVTLDWNQEPKSTPANSDSPSAALAGASMESSALSTAADPPSVLSRAWSVMRDRLVRRAAGADTNAVDAGQGSRLEDEVAQRLAAKHDTSFADTTAMSTVERSRPSWPLLLFSQWCMHFSCRQHDGTFVSTTNTIWRYLWYYNKLSLCQLFAVTADTQPIGSAPPLVNDVIAHFWRERQLGCRQGATTAGDRFHILLHSYVTAIDTNANVATLYDYKNNTEVRLPFHLLLLDLPLRAPGFVRQSGLHRSAYVEECVLPALAAGTHAAAAADPAATRATPTHSVDNKEATLHVEAGSAAGALRKNPLLGKTRAELDVVFADEASFMDVDPVTLQHRRFKDVFAVGDVAGLPTAKSYGAVFAQVPVVSHNVRQVLKAQELEEGKQPLLSLQEKQELQGRSDAVDTTRKVVPRVNARYTGYTSYHVIMTTWRAMWPEMHYNFDPYAKPAAAEAGPQQEVRWDLTTPLTYCDHHVWDNLAWRDPRGVLNAMYYQCALYELMYFFVFSRAQWHPPTWFLIPTYSMDDGTPSVPSLVDFL